MVYVMQPKPAKKLNHLIRFKYNYSSVLPEQGSLERNDIPMNTGTQFKTNVVPA